MEEYALHYLDTFKKPYICEKAYKSYVSAAKNHIFPTIGSKPINELTATDCQLILTALKEKQLGRTRESIFSLLKWICLGALAGGYLSTNPMAIVRNTKHRRKKGKQIPANEVRAYLSKAPKERYDYLIRFLLYTGIRPAEISSAVFSERTVRVKNAKTPIDEEPTYRTIPLHPELLSFVPTIKTLLDYNTDCLNHKFKRHFPKYRLYDCRHTFTSRIQECGANKEWVDYITDHVGEQNTTTRVYTHWSEEFSILQMEKLAY